MSGSRRTPSGRAAAEAGALFLAAMVGLLGAAGAVCGAGRGPSRQASTLVVTERFLSPRAPNDNIDSPAVWHGPAGQHWLLATAKTAHQLVVYDAITGQVLRRVGGPGAAPGRFARPNGVAVWGNVAVVVERDNHRLQVLALPGLEPLGVLGSEVLRRPYGLAVAPGADAGEVLVFVTDNYETADGRIPADGQLGERVRRFALHLETPLRWDYQGAFGDTTGAGRLPKVESIWADPDRRLLLVADEAGLDLKAYTYDGAFTGELVGTGLFRHEPEGIALHACGSQDGYWVVTDQDPRENRFLVFRRADFAFLGAFAGRTTTNTDGVALSQVPFGPFADGAFYAVHDDGGVAAFDWGEVLQRLGLRPDCRSGP